MSWYHDYQIVLVENFKKLNLDEFFLAQIKTIDADDN